MRMGYLELNFAEAFINATSRELRLAGKNFANVVKGYGNQIENGAGLARVNQLLADKMHTAVLQAYEQNVLAESIGPYRVGSRSRLSGKLLEALRSPTMAIGSSTGIGFIDDELLDETARHWKRLNFGAGPADGSLPRPRARVQFGSNQGFSLSLPDPPRPNFNVPETPAGAGYFLGNGQFYPGFPNGGHRKNAVRIINRRTASGDLVDHPSVHGIGARRFLDAGLASLGENFRPAYINFFQDAERRALSGEKNRVIT